MPLLDLTLHLAQDLDGEVGPHILGAMWGKAEQQ